MYENSKHKKVLFIHHGGIAGGAPLSMLYTMKGVRSAGYKVIAALMKPSQELHELYNLQGFETIETPWIPKFITWSGSEGKWYNPTTWKGVYDAWKMWDNAHQNLELLLIKHKIDVVHLNSVGLSNPATLLMKLKKPFVWHVREHGPTHKGMRYRFIQKKLLAAEEIIFLSKAEQRSWTGANEHGTVVNNFVNFDQFDKERSGDLVKTRYSIPINKKVILYVGGKKQHKGIFELLAALHELKKQLGDSFICLMPDSELNPVNPSTVEQKIKKLILDLGLVEQCILLPFSPDIVEMFAACDVLVFPATKPHFARPIIEASAMGKPVIATDLPAIDELVINGKTGFLVPLDNIEALAGKMANVLSDKVLARKMGGQGVDFAKDNFGFDGQMEKIINVYKRL